jgi:hypothetical protein
MCDYWQYQKIIFHMELSFTRNEVYFKGDLIILINITKCAWPVKQVVDL